MYNHPSYTHFDIREFDSPDLLGSGKNMFPTVVSLWDEIREEIGFPLKVNSGYRTPNHNASLPGASPSSSHMKGLATDFHLPTLRQKILFIRAARKRGFSRFGIGKYYVHADLDVSKPSKWWKYSGVSDQVFNHLKEETEPRRDGLVLRVALLPLFFLLLYALFR